MIYGKQHSVGNRSGITQHSNVPTRTLHIRGSHESVLLSLIHILNTSPVKVAWETVGKCMCTCGKMLPNYIATTAITCSLPTLLSANRQQTVSITYYIYGNSLVSNKNATNYILPVSCPTKKLCSVNYENSSGRYSS